jgi:adenosylhomocysteine nucleosidase
MASVLVLTPDPNEFDALQRALRRRGIPSNDIRLGTLDGVSIPSLDMLVAVGGNGKAQFGIQAQYLIDRCGGTELLVCVGAAGRLSEEVKIGDIVLGTTTVEHDYKERFKPMPFPRHDATSAIVEEFVQLAKSTSFPFHVHVGPIASGDEDIVDPIRAAEVRAATDALCVAWEGSGGARAARLNGLGFIEVRGVTDAADGDAARFFHSNLGDVMSNALDLLVGWSMMRRPAV